LISIGGLLVAPHLEKRPDQVKAVSYVLQGLRFLIGIVALPGEIVDDPLPVALALFLAQASRGDSAYDWMEVVPPRLTIVLQQAAPLQVADSFLELLRL